MMFKNTIFCIVAAHMVALTHTSSRRDIINNAPQLTEKPDWILSCSQENPNKDDCFRRMFEGMFPNLAKGVPELGIDHFEPLIIDSVQVSKGSGSLTLIGGFKNLNIKGPSNATVSRASLDLEKKLLSFDLLIPRIDATYNLKGNILLLPLVGNGNVAMTMKDVKSSVYTKISIKKKPECWDDCTVSTSINKSILATWSLGVTSMVRENSLVSANIAWESQNSPSDCLVTWEVSGGGLIGNLLTQSSNVELSLWRDTKYRVQVTCKNKRTEEISRSLPLTLDTGLALVMVRVPTAQPNKSREITVLDDAKIFTTYLLVDQPIESPFSFESLYDSNKEFVIGSLVVACICIVLLLAYIISKRKSSATDKLPLIDADDVSINCDENRKKNYS